MKSTRNTLFYCIDCEHLYLTETWDRSPPSVLWRFYSEALYLLAMEFGRVRPLWRNFRWWPLFHLEIRWLLCKRPSQNLISSKLILFDIEASFPYFKLSGTIHFHAIPLKSSGTKAMTADVFKGFCICLNVGILVGTIVASKLGCKRERFWSRNRSLFFDILYYYLSIITE